MSFFSGPVPYHEQGQKPKEHWKHIGWNPIQAGDDHGHGSKVTGFKKTKTTIYVKCIPMQWPLDNIPGECTYEAFIELKLTLQKMVCFDNSVATRPLADEIQPRLLGGFGVLIHLCDAGAVEGTNPHFPFLIGAPRGILSEGEKANS